MKNVIKTLFCFVFVLILVSCGKETITSQMQGINENIETKALAVKPKIETRATESQIDSMAKQSIADMLKLFTKRMPSTLKSASSEGGNPPPQYVGVLSNGNCGSNAIGTFIYEEDLENNASRTRYDQGTYTTPGIQSTGGSNARWTVCVVDASRFQFYKMNKAYAIFFLNQSNLLFIHVDDEDDKTKNYYVPPSTMGFYPNVSGYPMQVGSYDNDYGWTHLYLYYFPANPASTAKLPNLGFEYSVFGNFGTSATQSRFYFDTEDTNNSNYWTILYSAGGSSNGHYPWGELDPSFHVINLQDNIEWYIQNASDYRY
jgi:hypothetical protein